MHGHYWAEILISRVGPIQVVFYLTFLVLCIMEHITKSIQLKIMKYIQTKSIYKHKINTLFIRAPTKKIF